MDSPSKSAPTGSRGGRQSRSGLMVQVMSLLSPKKKTMLPTVPKSEEVVVIKKAKMPKNKKPTPEQPTQVEIEPKKLLQKSLNYEKKRKRIDSDSLGQKSKKVVPLHTESKSPETKKLKIVTKNASSDIPGPNRSKVSTKSPTLRTMEEAVEKYPVLNDEALVQKFMKVVLTNNQKGRIRVNLRNYFMSSSSEKDPEAIHMKLSAVLAQTERTDSDYRKIRILHNMLRTTVKEIIEKTSGPKTAEKKKKNNSADKTNKNVGGGDNATETKAETTEKPEKQPKEARQLDKNQEKPNKIKGPKRYVVFVGNLPYDVEKDSIMRHFYDIVNKIKDVRIPKRTGDKKGGIAYLELADEQSYEMALSKHHSMMENRRLNVLYTTTGKSKVDKTEAKGKTAKLVALQKCGKLLGSTPLNKKRSARRKKLREAQAKQQAQKLK